MTDTIIEYTIIAYTTMEVYIMLLRLFSYMGKYRKFAFLAIFCITAESIFELLVPFIMADLIDIGVARGDRATI